MIELRKLDGHITGFISYLSMITWVDFRNIRDIKLKPGRLPDVQIPGNLQI